MFTAGRAACDGRSLGEGDKVCAKSLINQRLDGSFLSLRVVLRAPLRMGVRGPAIPNPHRLSGGGD